MSKNAPKDANAVVLTDEVRQAIEDGGAVRMPVPTDLIRYGNNPRKRKGFDPESMRELAETIARDGLLKNILVRQVSSEGSIYYEIVAGERRTRAIRSLREEDRMVRDQTTGQMAPASEVYVTIPALVQGGCDDGTATRLAFLENDQHVPLSDADVIDLCVTLEAQGKTRKEIADLLGKSQAWLSHTFGFMQRLTPSNYEKLRSGEINRSVATKLMDYEPEVQVPIIEAAKEIAIERHEATKEKVQKDLVAATEVMDKAFQEKMETARQKTHDERAKKVAEQKVESAEKKVKKAVERKIQVEETIPTPSQSDVAEAAFRVTGAAHGNKNLNSAQIREHFTDKARNLLAIGDGGDPLDIETGCQFLRRDLELAALLSDAIATGNRDFAGILRSFYKETGTWTTDGKINIKLVGAATTPRSVEDDEELDEELDEEDDDSLDGINWDDDDAVPVGDSNGGYGDFDLADLGNEDDD